jgi:Tol biopolymer transport system component
MSPEQIEGKDIDRRADLFSLGVVFYEMITGRAPFEGDNEAATMKAVCDNTPEPLARYRSGVPEGLQAIVNKALDKSPDMRYQTAADLATDTKRLAANASTSDIDVQLPRRYSRRNLLISALAAVIIVALGLIGILNLLKDDDAFQVVPVFKRVTSFGDVDICDLSPDATYFAYSRLVGERHAEVMVDDIEGGIPLKVFESQIIRTLQWSPDGKELLIEAGDDTASAAFVVSRFGGDVRRYDISFAPMGRSLLWHPDASKFVHMTYDSCLVTVNKLTGDTSSVRTELEFARLLDWSATGNLILFRTFVEDGGGFLGIMRPDGGGLQRLVESARREAAFSARGDAVYLAEGVGIMNRLMRQPIDEATGAPRGNPEILLPSVPMFRSLSVSADGGRLLMRQRIASSNLHKVLLALESGQTAVETEPITFGTGFHSVPSISPDGRFIAFADYAHESYQLFVVPADGGERRQLTYSGFGNLAGDWSPNGKQLAYFRITDVSAREVFISVVDLSRGTSRDVVRHSVMACTPGFSLDWAPGSAISTKAPYCAGIWLVDPESGDTTTIPLAESEVAIRDPHFSPDTSLIAFHWDRDGLEFDGIWTRSLVDGQTRFIANFDAYIFGWSPDGEWIYFHHMGEDGLLRIARVHLESVDVQTMAVLQWDIPNSYNWVDLAPDASWAVIEKETSQTDVWVVDNFDPYAK